MEQQRLHGHVGWRMGRSVGIWVLVGLAVILVGVLFESQYVAVCEALNDDRPCSPVSKPMLAGYSLVFFGVISVLLAPVVLGLRAEARTDERSSRGVWRATNYGLLAGFLFVGVGVLVLIFTG